MRYAWIPYAVAALMFGALVGWSHAQMPTANASTPKKAHVAPVTHVASKATPVPGDLSDDEYTRLDEKAEAECAAYGEQMHQEEEVPGARQVIVTCGTPGKVFLLRP